MKTCTRCGYADLHWSLIDGKWKLLTIGGQIHFCKPKPAPKPAAPKRDFWSPEAYLVQPKQPTIVPPEAMYDYRHTFWAFLDGAPTSHVKPKKRVEQMQFKEFVP